MPPTEAKRRGRPPRGREVVESPEVETESAPEFDESEIEIPRVEPNTTPCHLCGLPLERSTRLLKAYDLAVLRCVRCHHTAIEGDEPHRWYDITTAISGDPPPLVVRARAIYNERRPYTPPPVVMNGELAAITSEWGDPRWTEYKF